MEISNSMPQTASMFPDIDVVSGDNPTLASINSPFTLQFYQTRETLDAENYRKFIDNAVRRFRDSVTYTHYKGYLINLGMNRCQVAKNITVDMATIEMHHNIITVHDIALILSEYVLKTVGRISTFDLVQLLKEEHKAHRIPLVMLSLTPHELYHNEEIFIHPKQCFGKWWEFLERYHVGITQDIAFKILKYLRQAIESDESDDNGFLDLYEKVKSWSEENREF